MTTRLTLNIDAKLVDKAKQVSKKRGVSLSKLIEKYLLEIISEEKRKTKKRSSLDDLIITQVPKDFDYKEELFKILMDKYK